MDNLLQAALVDEHCNACGDTYRVTLYDLLQEYRLQREWRPGRPTCAACSMAHSSLMTAIPEDAVEALSAAWERIAEAARAGGLDLRTGP
jgi:hypothetical protein